MAAQCSSSVLIGTFDQIVELARPVPPILSTHGERLNGSFRNGLRAALRQKVRPIVIEDPDLARPFARLLRARALPLRALGGLVADTMSFAIKQCYGADIEAHWYIGQYVLPGNVQN